MCGCFCGPPFLEPLWSLWFFPWPRILGILTSAKIAAFRKTEGTRKKWVPKFPTALQRSLLGPPVVPFYPFWGEGSPTKIDYRKKGTLILTSLEDLVFVAKLGPIAALFCGKGPFKFSDQ